MMLQSRVVDGDPLRFTANIDTLIDPGKKEIAYHAADVFAFAIGTIAANPNVHHTSLVDASVSRLLERNEDDTDARYQERVLLERTRTKRMDEYGITPREQEVTDLVAQGANNQQIADMLSLAESTVKTLMTRILERIGGDNRSHVISVLYLGHESPSKLFHTK